jgi:hypothetical protein
MGWLQKVTPYPGDIDGVQRPFERLYEERGRPDDFAMFTRSSIDGNSEIYLVTPAAADAVGSGWEPAEDPSTFGWGLLVGPADAFERFGLSETGTIDAVNPARG